MSVLPPRAGGLRLVRAVVLFVCLGTALNSVAIYVTWKLNDKSNQALCAFRDDLDRRVSSQREFLADHPAGIPGISAATIRTGIENQERTIVALRILSCR